MRSPQALALLTALYSKARTRELVRFMLLFPALWRHRESKVSPGQHLWHGTSLVLQPGLAADSGVGS